MNLSELRRYKPQILELAEKAGISDVRVFGSVARGEAEESSDIDLLVHVHYEKKGIGMDFLGFHVDMQDLLECDVDIVADDAVNRHIRSLVLAEAVPL